MKHPLVSFLVLGFYIDEKFIKCINSLNNQNFSNYEIILVWSSIPANFQLKKFLLNHNIDLSKIIIKEYKENLGYARGNNISAKIANGEFLIIINPDVEIDANFINQILKTYQFLEKRNNSDRIIVGPRISNKEGIIEYSRRTINFLGFSNMDISKTDKIRRTMISSGCAFLIKKQHYFEIGGFEDYYFMYHEDIDFSIRAENLGFKQYIDNSIILWHLKSDEGYKMGKFKYYYHERNRIMFTIEHSNKKGRILICHLLMEPFHIFYAIWKGFFSERKKIYKYLYSNRKTLSNNHSKEGEKPFYFYDMDGIFNEVNGNTIIIHFFNFYAKMLYYLYHH